MAGLYDSDKPTALRIAELGDTIFIAESEITPFSRLLPRGSEPKQMLSTWPLQKYPTRAFSGTLDGTDKATFSATNRDPCESYGMWMMSDGWMVTKIANLTYAAGVGKAERAKQVADDSLLFAQQIERQLLSTDDTTVESLPTVAYKSRGAFSWLQTAAQSTKPVPASYRPAAAAHYSGALSAFLPTNMETMLEESATQKKAPVDLTGYVGIKLKTQMSTWAQRDSTVSATNQNLQSFNINQSEKKLMRIVDFFEFDSGMVRTIPSWFLRCSNSDGSNTDYTPRSGLFVDLSMWEIAFLQSPASYVEPPKSGGPRGYHDAVYILKCLNPLGQNMVESNS